MLDFVIRNARLAHRPDEPGMDIGFERGRIAAVEPRLVCDAPAFDAENRLCCGGLVETHIHLDKSRIIDRCAPEEGRMAHAVRRVQAVKKDFTVEDVHARAKQTLENCLEHGTTRMRTHVEIDPGVGLRGFEGVRALVADYAWAIDLELCVFPQEGLTDNPGQIRRVFELAREFDVDIDMHLDFGNSPEDLDIHLVCELTEEHGLGGRVAVGHATKLSTLPPDRQREIARRLGDVGVAVTILPATDLFLMGRDQDHNVRRGLVDANLFVEEGCNCSISSNNILNPFTPYGDGSLMRMANLHANVLQVSHPHRLRDCFDMVTQRSARLMNLGDYGLEVGNPADVVVIDATSPEQAVAEIAEPLAVFKRGRRTVTRARTELHP